MSMGSLYLFTVDLLQWFNTVCWDRQNPVPFVPRGPSRGRKVTFVQQELNMHVCMCVYVCETLCLV